MSDNEQKPALRNILSEYKTRLIGRPVDGAKKAPTFAFTINDKNDVSIKAYSNIEGDRGNGMISGRGDISVLFMITALVRAAVSCKGAFKRTVKHEDHSFIRGQRSERPMWQFDLMVVRDAGDADVRLVLKSYNRADLEFFFRPSDYHRIVDGNGQELSTAELADGYALGWCEMVEDLASDLLKDYQVRFYTETNQPTVEGRPPSLVFGSIANNPRATVFTNIEADQHHNKGMIPGKIDAPVFYTYCQLIGQAVSAPAGWRRGIKNYGNGPKQQNGRWGEKVHETTMVVGKNEEGVIYIAVLDQDRSRPNLQFALAPHRRYTVLDENGNVMTADRASALMAIAYKGVLERSVAKHLNSNYVQPDTSQWTGNRQGGGGGQQGGQRQWGNNNNQQGGGQRQWNNNNNNNRNQGNNNSQYQGGGNNQRQDGGSQHSGGNPNSEVQQPQVLSRASAPVAFDESIPF